MSELDIYLLVALSCTICGFFIGMGQMMVIAGHEIYGPDSPPTPGAQMVFSLVGLVGIGYFIAWLWISYQPMFKIIPVFLLAAFAAIFGGGLTKAKITPMVPVVGLVVMPAMFHAASYFGIT